MFALLSELAELLQLCKLLAAAMFFNKFSILSVHRFYINTDFVFWKWFSFQVIFLLYANDLSLVVCHELPTKIRVLNISGCIYSLDLTGYLNNMVFFPPVSFLHEIFMRKRKTWNIRCGKSMFPGVHASLNIPRVSCKNNCEK